MKENITPAEQGFSRGLEGEKVSEENCLGSVPQCWVAMAANHRAGPNPNPKPNMVKPKALHSNDVLGYEHEL